MLFLARAEQPAAAVQREAIDLHAVVAQLCDYFEGMAEERGITLVNAAHGTLQPPSNEVIGISVSNQGAPIAPEHLPRLFDRFYRCDPARAVRVESSASGTRFVLIFKPNQPLAQAQSS